MAGVGGVDSSYLALAVPSITDHNHKDFPAILVFIEYLCCLEVGKQTVAMELVVTIVTLVNHLPICIPPPGPHVAANPWDGSVLPLPNSLPH